MELQYLIVVLGILFIRMVTMKWLEDNSFPVKNGKCEQLIHSHSFLQG